MTFFLSSLSSKGWTGRGLMITIGPPGVTMVMLISLSGRAPVNTAERVQTEPILAVRSGNGADQVPVAVLAVTGALISPPPLLISLHVIAGGSTVSGT